MALGQTAKLIVQTALLLVQSVGNVAPDVVCAPHVGGLWLAAHCGRRIFKTGSETGSAVLLVRHAVTSFRCLVIAWASPRKASAASPDGSVIVTGLPAAHASLRRTRRRIEARIGTGTASASVSSVLRATRVLSAWFTTRPTISTVRPKPSRMEWT